MSKAQKRTADIDKLEFGPKTDLDRLFYKDYWKQKSKEFGEKPSPKKTSMKEIAKSYSESYERTLPKMKFATPLVPEEEYAERGPQEKYGTYGNYKNGEEQYKGFEKYTGKEYYAPSKGYENYENYEPKEYEKYEPYEPYAPYKPYDQYETYDPYETYTDYTPEEPPPNRRPTKKTETIPPGNGILDGYKPVIWLDGRKIVVRELYPTKRMAEIRTMQILQENESLDKGQAIKSQGTSYSREKLTKVKIAKFAG